MSITEILVVVTCIMSVIAFYNREVMQRMIFNPYMISEHGQWYRFFSSGFIHADWIHLAVNMIVLWSFGAVVEQFYGFVFNEKASFYYILLYFGGLLISITPSYKKHRHNFGYNALGASGAVSSILFAAILFQPLQPVYLYGVIELPGILIGVAYLVYSYYMNRKGGDNVNHDAHFWGAVYGVLFTIAMKPSVAVYFIDQLTSFF